MKCKGGKRYTNYITTCIQIDYTILHLIYYYYYSIYDIKIVKNAKIFLLIYLNRGMEIIYLLTQINGLMRSDAILYLHSIIIKELLV